MLSGIMCSGPLASSSDIWPSRVLSSGCLLACLQPDFFRIPGYFSWLHVFRLLTSFLWFLPSGCFPDSLDSSCGSCFQVHGLVFWLLFPDIRLCLPVFWLLEVRSPPPPLLACLPGFCFLDLLPVFRFCGFDFRNSAFGSLL